MIEDRPKDLERLKDLEEIRALTVRYGDSRVRGIFIPDLFVDDGVMDFADAGYGRYVGRSEITRFYSAAADNLVFEAHLVVNQSISTWDGDLAKGLCSTLGLAGFHSIPDATRFDVVTYTDTYQRTDRGWLFRSRKIETRVPTSRVSLQPWKQEAWSENLRGESD